MVGNGNSHNFLLLHIWWLCIIFYCKTRVNACNKILCLSCAQQHTKGRQSPSLDPWAVISGTKDACHKGFAKSGSACLLRMRWAVCSPGSRRSPSPVCPWAQVWAWADQPTTRNLTFFTCGVGMNISALLVGDDHIRETTSNSVWLDHLWDLGSEEQGIQNRRQSSADKRHRNHSGDLGLYSASCAFFRYW